MFQHWAVYSVASFVSRLVSCDFEFALALDEWDQRFFHNETKLVKLLLNGLGVGKYVLWGLACKK